MLTRDFLCSQRNQTQQGSKTETVEERQGEGEEEGGGGGARKRDEWGGGVTDGGIER